MKLVDDILYYYNYYYNFITNTFNWHWLLTWICIWFSTNFLFSSHLIHGSDIEKCRDNIASYYTVYLLPTKQGTKGSGVTTITFKMTIFESNVLLYCHITRKIDPYYSSWILDCLNASKLEICSYYVTPMFTPLSLALISCYRIALFLCLFSFIDLRSNFYYHLDWLLKDRYSTIQPFLIQ